MTPKLNLVNWPIAVIDLFVYSIVTPYIDQLGIFGAFGSFNFFNFWIIWLCEIKLIKNGLYKTTNLGSVSLMEQTF